MYIQCIKKVTLKYKCTWSHLVKKNMAKITTGIQIPEKFYNAGTSRKLTEFQIMAFIAVFTGHTGSGWMQANRAIKEITVNCQRSRHRVEYDVNKISRDNPRRSQYNRREFVNIKHARTKSRNHKLIAEICPHFAADFDWLYWTNYLENQKSIW